MGDPVQVPAQRHPVQLVEPVQRHHGVQPAGDRRLGEPGRRGWIELTRGLSPLRSHARKPPTSATASLSQASPNS